MRSSKESERFLKHFLYDRQNDTIVTGLATCLQIPDCTFKGVALHFHFDALNCIFNVD